MIKLDGGLPQARADGGKLHFLLRRRAVHGGQLLIALNPPLLLRGPGLGTPADPGKLRPENVLSCPLLGLGDIHPLCLQGKIALIIALIGIELSLVQLHDAIADAVQEIAVMGHHEKRAPEALEIAFQPLGHGTVQVVRGLVQHQKVRCGQERGRQRHTLPLSPGQGSHLLGEVADAQAVQQLPGLCLQIINVLLSFIVMDNGLEDTVLRLKCGILREEADAQPPAPDNIALIRLHKTRHHPEQSRFSGAVHADERHLLALLNGKIRIVENLSFREHLAEVLHV